MSPHDASTIAHSRLPHDARRSWSTAPHGRPRLLWIGYFEGIDSERGNALCDRSEKNVRIGSCRWGNGYHERAA